MHKYYIILVIIGCLIVEVKLNAQTVTDIDGNIYNTVTIGTQVWTTSNLKVTKFNNGNPIPLITDNSEWENLTSPGYCWYDNNEQLYRQDNGAMYNWYTVNEGNLCPTGWHVPSNDEWYLLMEFLGGGDIAGKKMCAVSNGGTNKSGLSLVPTGVRFVHGGFDGIAFWGGWWTTSENENPLNGYLINIDKGGWNYEDSSNEKQWGIGVRCVKDKALSTNEITLGNNVILYPNPASNVLRIKGANPNSLILIFNAQGKLVKECRFSNDVDISQLFKGIYVVKIIDNVGITEAKFVKE